MTFFSTGAEEFHMNTNKTRRTLSLLATLAACSAVTVVLPNIPQAQAKEKTTMVGGAAMYPSKNIVENAVNSKDHTTLVAAVQAAGLAETLSGPGPFTVFAPTNEAFNKLPTDTVPTLLKPENKDTLTSVLTYHVVRGYIVQLEGHPQAH